MKVLIIRMWPDVLDINNYNSQELGLAKALINSGNECDIVLYTKNESKEEDYFFDNGSIKIYHLKAFNFFKNAIFEKKLYDIIKKYDIVQTTEYDQIGNLILYKKIREKLVIYHGPYESTFTKGYKKKIILSDFFMLFFPGYKKIPVITKSLLATNFVKNKKFMNIYTIGVGLDNYRFCKKEHKNKYLIPLLEKKEKYDLKYILYIGKIEERRNISFIIERLKDINNINSNVRLIMVGNGSSKYKEKIFKYAKELNVFDNIIYYERLSQIEIPYLYKICDLFILPTQYEIFGMVMLEAMYFGLPVITTPNGGSSVLIENEYNGYVSSLNNINLWNKYIKESLFNNNKNLSLRRNASKTIKDKYLWDKIVVKFIEAYNNILSQ